MSWGRFYHSIYSSETPVNLKEYWHKTYHVRKGSPLRVYVDVKWRERKRIVHGTSSCLDWMDWIEKDLCLKYYRKYEIESFGKKSVYYLRYTIYDGLGLVPIVKTYVFEWMSSGRIKYLPDLSTEKLKYGDSSECKSILYEITNIR